jgi:hypothetical protein
MRESEFKPQYKEGGREGEREEGEREGGREEGREEGRKESLMVGADPLQSGKLVLTRQEKERVKHLASMRARAVCGDHRDGCGQDKALTREASGKGTLLLALPVGQPQWDRTALAPGHKAGRGSRAERRKGKGLAPFLPG